MAISTTSQEVCGVKVFGWVKVSLKVAGIFRRKIPFGKRVETRNAPLPLPGGSLICDGQENLSDSSVYTYSPILISGFYPTMRGRQTVLGWVAVQLEKQAIKIFPKILLGFEKPVWEGTSRKVSRLGGSKIKIPLNGVSLV